MQDRNSVGIRIYELLKNNGMKQKELAECVGMTEVSISRYIRGHRTPNGRNIVKIASVLHTTTDYLLYGQNNEEENFMSYHQVKNTIKRYAKKWSIKQKKDLVISLFAEV